MAGTSSIRLRDDGALAPWIWVPLVGLAALVLVGTRLKVQGCDGGLGAEPLGKVFEVFGFGAVLALLGAGIWRWTIVFNRGERGLNLNLVAAVLVAMFLALAVAFVDWDAFPAVLVGELGLGALVTLVAFVGLIVRVRQGRKADEAGVLLPIYLLGCCFFLFAPFVLYEGIRVGGCFR